MQLYAYSPDTGEIINTSSPAAWMSTTTIAPPVFDATKESAFFTAGAWVVSSCAPSLVAEIQAKAVADYQQSAKVAMDATSVTMERIQEAVILGKTTYTTTDVVAWATYRSALRSAISAASVGTLPTKPPYPANT